MLFHCPLVFREISASQVVWILRCLFNLMFLKVLKYCKTLQNTIKVINSYYM